MTAVRWRGSSSHGFRAPAEAQRGGADEPDTERDERAENVGGRSPPPYLDRATLVAMAAGLAISLWPAWERALEVGFFVTLIATVAQIVVGHLPREER